MLRRPGWPINPIHVARLRHELDLVGEAPRRTPRTTHSPHEYGRYPNFVAAVAVRRPDQVWVADIPYVALQQEFVSLAVLI